MLRLAAVSHARSDLSPLILSLVIYCAITATLLWLGVAPTRPGMYLDNAVAFGCTWLFIFLGHAVPSVIRARPPGSLFVHLWRHEFGPAYRQRLLTALPTIAALTLFVPTFSTAKSALPIIAPFTWDPTFIALDHAIHGVDPWRPLQLLFGRPVVTALLALLYNLWIFLIFAGGIYLSAYQPDRSLARRFVYTFLLCWTLLGLVAAAAFGSYGPCFVGPILGDPRFDEQMAYLRQADQSWPVMSLQVQEILLSAYRSGARGLGMGISAFPSMHVSLAFLFFLVSRRLSSRLGWFALAYLGVIVLGSIHLGYHYAVDCYAAIVGTYLIWKATGWWEGRREEEASTMLVGANNSPVGATK